MSTWLFSKKIDLVFLFVPVWFCWLISFLIPENLYQMDIPIWIWVVIVLGIDVGHVWSTLFRTYLDPDEFSNHRRLLLMTPMMAFLAASLVAGYSISLFWTVLAYIAVYHFMKQQYGFLALYNYRSGIRLKKKIFEDKWVIYLSMLYPVMYWHLTGLKNFHWFETGDFIYLNSFIQGINLNMIELRGYTDFVYFSILLGWLIEEIYWSRQTSSGWRYGKILWMFSTSINWYLGIVFFNSDLVFTITNVVAHGIPYMALIIYYRQKKEKIDTLQWQPAKVFRLIALLVSVVFILAFFEEYMWDILLFREKGAFFESILPYTYPAIENRYWQAIAFGILSVPQLSHYIIDGFIWKGNDRNPYIKKIFGSTV